MSNKDSPEFYKEAAREVTELLESAAHLTIWRTSYRMFEILQQAHPNIATNNPFLRDFRRFVAIVVGVTSGRVLQSAKIEDILSQKERFEEGEDHPVFYKDALDAGNDKRIGLFFELSLHELLDAGWNYDDALLILCQEHSQNKLLVRETRLVEGYHPGLLRYYKIPRDDGKKDEREEPKIFLAA